MQNNINIMSSGTNFAKYIKWVSETTRMNINELVTQSEMSSSDAPFLSIVTRTQGKRPEALAETLLCLTGQTDMDFELLIIGHKLNDEQEKLVVGIIENLPEEMQTRTRLVKVDNGTRTTPLNEGFKEAKGEYIAILDDDDIVFDNWVEMFKKAAEKEPGAILHAYSLAQKWMTIKINNNNDGLRAVAAHTDEFCKKFDWIEQVNNNYCPPVGLAFPRYAFKNLGIIFDETLNTTEDWDFLMRTGLLVGVTDIEEPTCIYRLWTNTETSQTLHDKNEWKKNHKVIQDKFKNMPVLIPAEYTENLLLKETEDEEKEELVVKEEKRWSTLYFNNGTGFSEKESMLVQTKGKKKFVVSAVVDSVRGKYKDYRWDPSEKGGFEIDKLKISYIDLKGNEKEVSQNYIYTNGYSNKGKFLFLKSDPQVIFRINEDVTQITITGEFLNVSDDMLDVALKKNKSVKFYFGKIKNRLKRKRSV